MRRRQRQHLYLAGAAFALRLEWRPDRRRLRRDQAQPRLRLQGPRGLRRAGLPVLEGQPPVKPDKPRALAIFKIACDLGSGDGCTRAGIELEALDRDQARALYRKACELGYSYGCSNLANLRDDVKEPKRDRASALELWQQACDLGQPASCEFLAWQFHKGDRVSRDRARALALRQRGARFLRKECDDDQLDSCVELHEWLLFKPGLFDPVAAHAAASKACKGKNLKGCNAVAGDHQWGRGIDRDLTRAYQLYEQTCNAGHAPACGQQASLMGVAPGVARDDVKVRALYRRHCETTGDQWVCHRLALLEHEGRGGPPGTPSAIARWDERCSKRELAWACRILAALYSEGDGVPRDAARAQQLRERACKLGLTDACGPPATSTLTRVRRKRCDGGDLEACEKLASDYRSGDGAKHDGARAYALARVACAAGAMNACNNLGDMYETADYVPRSIPLALELYERSCAGGGGMGCFSLGDVAERGLGRPRSDDDALRRLTQSCELGVPMACARAVRLLRRQRSRAPAATTEPTLPPLCTVVAQNALRGAAEKKAAEAADAASPTDTTDEPVPAPTPTVTP